jgi:hypothetical protein
MNRVRVSVAGIAAITVCLVLECAAADDAVRLVKGVFHLAGVRELPRDQRVNLGFSGDSLAVMRKSKAIRTIPFARIQRVRRLAGSRDNPGAAYAAAVATMGMGGQLLILKKHKVDTFVIDYVNERGGEMGLALQMEPAGGARAKEWFEGAGVSVEEVIPQKTVGQEKPSK